MKTIGSMTLNESINQLRIKQAEQLVLLRDQFHLTYESLKPINLLKHTFKEAASPDIKEGILDNVIGVTTGYLSKGIFVGTSVNPVRKILGTLLQITVSTLIARNSDSIKSTLRQVLDRVFKAPVENNLEHSNNGNLKINIQTDENLSKS
ncbi:hypothetical protein WSM22_45700 [Cytophagales bacterium WSM2-2]|nr:hypothetical protein WSM22_45700 [Cytophagales bacterium WSM2-2]